MIYTLTCNPALDYAVRLDKFREGAINRSYGESIAPGGKGVNVSLVLKNLGVPTLAMGVAAGFTGEVLLEMLEARGVPTDRKSTRLNSSHDRQSRMPSSA